MSSDFTPGDNKPFIQTQIKSTQRLRYSFATQIGTIHRRPNSTPLDSMAEQARHRQEQAPELNQKRRPLPASSLAKNNSGVSEDRKRLIDWPLRISPTGSRAEALLLLAVLLAASAALGVAVALCRLRRLIGSAARRMRCGKCGGTEHGRNQSENHGQFEGLHDLSAFVVVLCMQHHP